MKNIIILNGSRYRWRTVSFTWVIEYEIEEYQPLLTGGAENSMSDDHADGYSDFVQLSINNFDDDPEFNEYIRQVEFAIDHNIMPQRIYEGSSGSYFAKNSEFVIVY